MQRASLDVQAEWEFLNFRLFVQLSTFYFKLCRRKESNIFIWTLTFSAFSHPFVFKCNTPFFGDRFYRLLQTCFFQKKKTVTNSWWKRLRWSRGSVLAFGTQVRGIKPGLSRRIFQGEKILSMPSFGGEVKPSVPCRRFTACKRFLNATWKSGISGKIHSAISRPHNSTFGYQDLWGDD